MNTTLLLQVIAYLIILCSAFPLSNIIAKLCADEIVKDRKYIRLMAILSTLVAIVLLFVFFRAELIFTLVYFSLTLSLILRKSFDKKFVKKYT